MMVREPYGNDVGDHMAMPSEPMEICICIIWQKNIYICTLDHIYDVAMHLELL